MTIAFIAYLDRRSGSNEALRGQRAGDSTEPHRQRQRNDHRGS